MVKKLEDLKIKIIQINIVKNHSDCPTQSDLKMGSINYAEIVFLKDKVEKVVPIEWIKISKARNSFFNPENELDFDAQTVYYVKWYYCGRNGQPCESNHKHSYEYHSSYITSLNESREAIKLNANSVKRKKFPTKKSLNYDTSTDADHESSNSETSDDNCTVSLAKKKLARKEKVSKENSYMIWDEHSSREKFVASRRKLSTTNKKTADAAVVLDPLPINENIISCKTYSAISQPIPRKQTARKSFNNNPRNDLSTRGIDLEDEELDRMLLTIEPSEIENNPSRHHLDEYYEQDAYRSKTPQLYDSILDENEISSVQNERQEETETPRVSEHSDVSTSEDEDEGEPYEKIDDFINFNGYKTAHHLILDLIMSKPKTDRKKALREMARLLFSENTLVKYCLKMDNVYEKTKNEFNVEQFPPEKLKYLLRLYSHYLKMKGIPKSVYKKIYRSEAKSTLRYYLRDLRAKALKRRQRNQTR